MKLLHRLLLTCIAVFFLYGIKAQDAPNFEITDSNGQEHNLYEDYLDQGTTVVIKFFFTTCPPCNAIAPRIQTLYEEWGEGAEDVEFFEISTQNFDNDQDVEDYKAFHSLTFPGVSNDGGAADARSPYTSGQFGTFFGTPSFAVIAPDRSVVYNTGGIGTNGKIQALSDAIAATGATGGQTVAPQPSTFSIGVSSSFGNVVSDVRYVVSSASDPSTAFPVNLTSTTLSITDLAEEFPGISDPVLRLSKSDNIRLNLTPLDILLIRKHILGIIPLEDEGLKMAADTNGDGLITPLDMLVLQKVILGVFAEFPIDSYQFIPNNIPLTLQPGQNQNITIEAVKVGDLNGF